MNPMKTLTQFLEMARAIINTILNIISIIQFICFAPLVPIGIAGWNLGLYLAGYIALLVNGPHTVVDVGDSLMWFLITFGLAFACAVLIPVICFILIYRDMEELGYYRLDHLWWTPFILIISYFTLAHYHQEYVLHPRDSFNQWFHGLYGIISWMQGIYFVVWACVFLSAVFESIGRERRWEANLAAHLKMEEEYAATHTIIGGPVGTSALTGRKRTEKEKRKEARGRKIELANIEKGFAKLYASQSGPTPIKPQKFKARLEALERRRLASGG